MKRLLRLALIGLGGAVAVLLLAVIGAYAFLQTASGKSWLAGEIGRLLSAPGQSVTVAGLDGSPPFDLRVGEIRIADGGGTWLEIRDARLDVVGGALLRRELAIRTLRAGAVEVARLPASTGSKPSSGAPSRLETPHLPFKVAVDALAIDRLSLAEPVLGEAVALTLTGDARIDATTSAAHLALRRIDQGAGAASLSLRLAGAPARLDLDAEVSDPTGLLVDRLLQRTDHPPLAIALHGSDPATDWHGKLTASAGTLLALEADVGLAQGDGWRMTLQGEARQNGLLPPDVVPLIGDRVGFSLRGALAANDVLTVEQFQATTAAAELTAALRLDQASQAVSGTAHLSVPDLAPAAALAGSPLAGRIDLDASFGGTVQRPTAALTLAGADARFDTLAIERLGADLRLAAAVNGRWDVAGRGELAGLSQAGQPLPAGLGAPLGWTLTAALDPAGSVLDLQGLTVTGAGLDLAAAGHLAAAGSEGTLRLRASDLGAYGGIVGLPALGGRLALDGALASDAGGRTTLTLQGGTEDLRTGIAAADALLGPRLQIKAEAARGKDGDVDLSGLSLTAAAAALDASGSLSASGDRLAGKFAVTVPKLAPLAPALGTPLQGELRLAGELGGSAQHPSLRARLDGRDLGSGRTLVRKLASEIAVRDLAQPSGTLSADIDAPDLRGRVDASFSRPAADRISVSKLVATAAGARLEGQLDYSLASGLASGKLTGRVPDLHPWSALAGTPLAGRADLALTLGAGGGQSAELTLTGNGLAAGEGAQSLRITRVALAGKATGLASGTPRGSATLDLAELDAGGVRLAKARLEAAARSSETVAFKGEADGRMTPPAAPPGARPMPIGLDFAGDWTHAKTGERVTLSQLAGRLDKDKLNLRRPLRLAVGPRNYRVDDLDLDVAGGSLKGNAALAGNDLVLKLAVDRLPLAPFGRLAGRNVSGTVDAAADLSGPVAAPRGRMTLNGRELHLLGAETDALPPVSVDLELVPHEGQFDLAGEVASREGQLLRIRGTVPVRIGAEPPSIAIPDNQRLGLRIDGEGKLETIATLLPIGEDRVAGHYQLALTVGGTLAAPVTGGRLTIDGGYYQNQAFGTELRNLGLELDGDLNRLRLVRLDADDGAAGKLSAAGTVDLAQSGSLDLQAKLARFLVAKSDDAHATANADVRVDGTLSAPKLTARIEVPQGEFRIPDRLPPSVVKLDVVEINGGENQQSAAAGSGLPIALDVTLDIPGQTFVRGRGLDSEWRGRIAITGTADQPAIAGGLQAVRGTLSLLGKDFTIRRGTINFPGGTLIDPQIDLLAEYAATDITAQIRLTGSASAPKLALTSEPQVPQDQILSRVLFGRDASQITPGQGLQLAYAASTLTSGGPDVLDRLRTATGLDRLSFGSGSNSSTLQSSSSVTNQSNATNSSATNPTVSGGKYVAPGVFVGVEQGASTQSTRSRVEIEITPHITAQSSMGANGSSQVGLDWRYDY